MLYFSKLRIIIVSFITLFFIFFASSNLFNFSNNLLNKKINLGLDLQGGSYLLLEIDNTPVIEQKLQNLREQKKEQDFGHCGDCRACWSKTVENISYPLH